MGLRREAGRPDVFTTSENIWRPFCRHVDQIHVVELPVYLP